EPAARLSAALVPVAVQGELVAGGCDLADELRVPRRLLAADEEDGGRANAFELREHGRRSLRVWAVVEAEQHPASARKPDRDPERPSHPWEDACRRRCPLQDKGATCGERERAGHGQYESRPEASRCTEETARPPARRSGIGSSPAVRSAATSSADNRSDTATEACRWSRRAIGASARRSRRRPRTTSATVCPAGESEVLSGSASASATTG